MLFPIIAPWINRDFAAIQPTHDHIYLGEVKPDHHHDTAEHAHPAEDTEHSANDDIIFLPDDTINQNSLFLIFDACALSMLYRLDTLGMSLLALSYQIESLSPLPPLPPPRLNLF